MTTKSDGSTASYYELPANSTELQHLISHRNMNYFIGLIFDACYDYSKSGSNDLELAREIHRIACCEVERLQVLQEQPSN